MSEEQTHNFDGRSFEERVFARFDAIDQRFETMDSRFDGVEDRLERLEVQAEKRSLETKPIWERALAELLEVKERVQIVEGRIESVEAKVESVEAKVESMQVTIDAIATDVLEVKEGLFKIDRKFEVVTDDLMQVRMDQRHLRKRVEHLESK